MKKIFLIAAIGLFTSLNINAQHDKSHNSDIKSQEKTKLKEKDVPQSVRSSFESNFPGARDIDWKMKHGAYKVSFEMNNVDHMAELSSSGEVLSRGTEINNSELPVLVADAVSKEFANQKIDDVYRVEKNGNTYYLVEIEGNPDRKLLYDAQGKLVKEKMKK